MKTVFLGLNEIKFDYVIEYIKLGELPNFKKMLDNNRLVQTTSENEYKLLEPWIQWVTIHTGLDYSEHKVFRLGDIVGRKDLKQIFEQLEEQGKSVSAVSPFNTENRLKKPTLFIPDPWTKTTVSGNFLVTKLHDVISKAVNNNTHTKLTLADAVILILSILKFSRSDRLVKYFGLLAKYRVPGVKAIILDALLADLFLYNQKMAACDFSLLFLNAGAHIQHHYLFNSKVYLGEFKNPEKYCPSSHDPLLMVLKEYDGILFKLLQLDNVHLVVATGLSQTPYNKSKYYWRLLNHASFLKELGVKNISSVKPRMSRDFLIEFSSAKNAGTAEVVLASVIETNSMEKVFAVDNRGESLFVELIYGNKINETTEFEVIETSIKIKNLARKLKFVAIKNGEHCGEGSILSTENIFENSSIALKEIHPKIIEYVMAS